jgi:hypothetical protein
MGRQGTQYKEKNVENHYEHSDRFEHTNHSHSVGYNTICEIQEPQGKREKQNVVPW